MELSATNDGDVTIVRILDEDSLDARNSPIFKSLMADILREHTKIVLNIENICFLDSSGLGAIVSCRHKLCDQGGEIKLCCMAKPVRVFFELVRMHKIVEIVDDCDQAVSQFRQSAAMR